MVGFLVIENNPHLDPAWPEISDKYIHMQVSWSYILHVYMKPYLFASER